MCFSIFFTTILKKIDNPPSPGKIRNLRSYIHIDSERTELPLVTLCQRRILRILFNLIKKAFQTHFIFSFLSII